MQRASQSSRTVFAEFRGANLQLRGQRLSYLINTVNVNAVTRIVKFRLKFDQLRDTLHKEFDSQPRAIELSDKESPSLTDCLVLKIFPSLTIMAE